MTAHFHHNILTFECFRFTTIVYKIFWNQATTNRRLPNEEAGPLCGIEFEMFSFKHNNLIHLVTAVG